MLTRGQARRAGIKVVAPALPTTSRKVKKIYRRNDDNIDGDMDAILAEIAALPIHDAPVLKKRKTRLTKRVAEKPVVPLNAGMDQLMQAVKESIVPGGLVPLIIESEQKAVVSEKPWAKWQPFLRKLFKDEPTDEQYELANTIWQHILKTANGATQISDRPIIRLYRDFRGGSPSQHLIDMIKEPQDVVLQVNSVLDGICDFPVAVYLSPEGLDTSMARLKQTGWVEPMYDPNNYEKGGWVVGHVFF